MSLKRTLILLDPRLSPAHTLFQSLSSLVGPAQVQSYEQVDDLEAYNRVILCAYQDAGPAVTDFVFNQLSFLSSHPVGLINVSSTPSDPGWLPDVASLIGCQAKSQAILTLDAPVQAVIDFGMAFRMEDHRVSDSVPFRELKALVEDFLKARNTCTLSTVYLGKVHSTPVEYRYQNGHLYCLSEGGEKFAGILHNGQVAVAIYDPFKGFDSLAGVQIQGKAKSFHPGSDEYHKILEIWNLSGDKIQSLPSLLHAIDIRLDEVILLWNALKSKGLEARQVFRFH